MEIETSFCLISNLVLPKVKDHIFFANLKGVFTPIQNGIYDFSLTVYGTVELWQTFCHNLEVNCGPLLDTVVLGSP